MAYPVRRIAVGNPAQKKFKYLWRTGKIVGDDEVLTRIRKLGVPPAYTNVLIFGPKAKIQAVGLDAKGRKQYRYHAVWVEERNRKKFRGLTAFAEAYPRIMRSVSSHISHKPSSKADMVALAIGLMNVCRIRPGNTKHLKRTGSFGTTTLLAGHVVPDATKLNIAFRGKSGVVNMCSIKKTSQVGRALAEVLRTKKHREEPIFTFDGTLVTPDDINHFLQEIGGPDVSAKAFRTYHANVLFLAAMNQIVAKDPDDSMTKRKAQTMDVIRDLAVKMHHTPSTFKTSYLFPPVRDLWIDDPDQFKKTFYKKDLDKALVAFIRKKTTRTPNTPKAWD